MGRRSSSTVRLLSASNGQSGQEANGQPNGVKGKVRAYLTANPDAARMSVNRLVSRSQGTRYPGRADNCIRGVERSETTAGDSKVKGGERSAYIFVLGHCHAVVSPTTSHPRSQGSCEVNINRNGPNQGMISPINVQLSAAEARKCLPLNRFWAKPTSNNLNRHRTK